VLARIAPLLCCPSLNLGENRVIPSSGNVFADLGFDQPEKMLLKDELVRQISAAIKEKGLNQYQAAELLASGLQTHFVMTLKVS
jgi:Helix-turn-helix domain